MLTTRPEKPLRWMSRVAPFAGVVMVQVVVVVVVVVVLERQDHRLSWVTSKFEANIRYPSLR
jgi:hypothetical protein